MVMVLDGQVSLAVVRGDHQLNVQKLIDATGAIEVRPADPAETLASLGANPGSLGPVGVSDLPVIVDESLRGRTSMTTGANEDDWHFRGVDVDRDLNTTTWADLREAKAGEPCPECGTPLDVIRCIEIGHIFKLGTTYSEAFGATVSNPDGTDVPIVMGSYGIGIGRNMAAVVEANYDDNGVLWPMEVAPFEAVVTLMRLDDEVMQAGEALYEELRSAGVDALLDDRDARAGVKFADAELIGIPLRITVGPRGLASGEVEVTDRSTGETTNRPLGDAAGGLRQRSPAGKPANPTLHRRNRTGTVSRVRTRCWLTRSQLVAFLVGVALWSSACISPGSDAADESETTTTTSRVPVDPGSTQADSAPVPYLEFDPAEPVRIEDQLVVARTDAITLLSGASEITIAEANGESLSQPVFSPDGSTLAWTQAGARSTVVLHDLPSGNQETMQTPFASFYTAWDPGSTSIAFLGNAPQGGVGLAKADVRIDGRLISSPEPTPVGIAVPFYFQWSQDSSQLLAHAGDGLSLVELDNQRSTQLEPVSRTFQTPAWTPDGAVAFAVVDALPGPGGSSELVRYTLDNGLVEPLLAFDGQLTMDLSPDGTTLAAGIISSGGGGPAPVAYRQTNIPTESVGVLTVDVASGEIQRLTDTLPLALEWSPDSERLLVLEHPAIQTGSRAQGAVNWLVIDNSGASHTTDAFELGATFASNYLPFYDQYAKSSTLWSSDSSRFVYPAVDNSGQTGIWVHAPGQGHNPVRVTDGDIAFWAPQGS